MFQKLSTMSTTLSTSYHFINTIHHSSPFFKTKSVDNICLPAGKSAIKTKWTIFNRPLLFFPKVFRSSGLIPRRMFWLACSCENFYFTLSRGLITLIMSINVSEKMEIIKIMILTIKALSVFGLRSSDP